MPLCDHGWGMGWMMLSSAAAMLNVTVATVAPAASDGSKLDSELTRRRSAAREANRA